VQIASFPFFGLFATATGRTFGHILLLIMRRSGQGSTFWGTEKIKFEIWPPLSCKKRTNWD